MKQRGFTLVEMLVALSIFALIASIGVGLLRASVTTQGAVQQRLGEMGAVNRLRSIMANDLAQAVLRPTRDPSGSRVAAFFGNAAEMSLVSRSQSGGADGPDVQRIAYRQADGNWQRAVATSLDGSLAAAGDALSRDVGGATLRYRDRRGEWRGKWSSDGDGGLPVAVELVLMRTNRAPLRMLFLTGPTLAPQEVTR